MFVERIKTNEDKKALTSIRVRRSTSSESRRSSSSVGVRIRCSTDSIGVRIGSHAGSGSLSVGIVADGEGVGSAVRERRRTHRCRERGSGAGLWAMRETQGRHQRESPREVERTRGRKTGKGTHSFLINEVLLIWTVLFPDWSSIRHICPFTSLMIPTRLLLIPLMMTTGQSMSGSRVLLICMEPPPLPNADCWVDAPAIEGMSLVVSREARFLPVSAEMARFRRTKTPLFSARSWLKRKMKEDFQT
jgi:hypothetical protein